ncbi:sulfotransferase domain-containing protein [Methylophaga pinxianii]|uniref:sulfotransferase domain-containing protein n=2 Tax=Methylophaga pinxianii TaxID=2881052 RepID=UPI001CF4FA87|nr:sulfotransferase domain-containing protein [Methylophaga pinxianii]MCB2426634.1 sulfotransferase domain-containing protein [Methylophaga pinxianii]UPH45106.1 sulfotransferase domain-containing protein [Methylophaga pinxianii]
MPKPDFIIIGAMKSATSTLHEQLALQPGFFMSTPKEPNFFSDDDIYNLGLDWYSDLFSKAEIDDICGESSTHYTKLPDYPQTLERMRSYLPSLKLIYVVRHPIDRLISHYMHQWSQNVIKTDINQAIEQFDELINYSRYSMQISPYIKQYGAENIHIVFSEALRVRPQYELEKVATFLGYSKPVIWYDDLPEQNVSSQRVRRFNGYKLIVDNPILAWLRRTFIPQSFRDKVKNRLTLQMRPEIDEHHKQKLTQIFNEDLAVLGSMLNVELTLQNYKEKAQTIDVRLTSDKSTMGMRS